MAPVPVEQMNLAAMSRPALEAAIAKHNRLYFIEQRPEISDDLFDAMVERLRSIAPESPVLQEIGAPLNAGRLVSKDIDILITIQTDKVEHPQRMLSLEKCYNADEFAKWTQRIRKELTPHGKDFDGLLLATPKVDGLAARLAYDAQGDLVLAATRGDGERGENITPNVRMISAIPQHIDPLVSAGPLEVRGEIYLPLSEFRRYEEHFANPRNLAAGAVKQKDPNATAAYNLSFFAYDAVLPTDKRFAREQDKFSLLERLGFPCPPYAVVAEQDASTLFAEHEKRRDGRDFEVDGVVFRLNQSDCLDLLGATAHHPKYAIAYKFASQEATSKLLGIEWSVGRSSAITPVALIEPVEIAGVIVQRVSLHNIGQIRRLGLTSGATLLVTRRGDVIPYVTAVLEATGAPIVAPELCPSCGAPTTIRAEQKSSKGEERSLEILYCTNPKDCGSSRTAYFEHFVKAIGCDGFGDKLIEQLYEQKIVQQPADFFTLTKDALLQLPRMGEKSATKLLAALSNARTMPLSSFLLALGIPGIGKHVAEILEQYAPFGELRDVEPAQLLSLHGIGEETASAFVLAMRERRSEIDELLRHVTMKERSLNEQRTAGPLSGKSFVFTGALERAGRKEAATQVEALGGIAADTVGKTLSYLVVGPDEWDVPKERAKSKLKKAHQLIDQGVPLSLLSEDAFWALLAQVREENP